MNHSAKRGLLVTATTVIALVFISTAAQAALSEALAKKCRALMVKAHPTVLYGASGTAGEQRAYFMQCVNRNGDMPEAKPPTTDARGTAEPLSPPPQK